MTNLDAMMGAVKAAAPGDALPLLAAADWCVDAGALRHLELGLRVAARRDYRPFVSPKGRSVWWRRAAAKLTIRRSPPPTYAYPPNPWDVNRHLYDAMTGTRPRCVVKSVRAAYERLGKAAETLLDACDTSNP